MAKRVKTTAVCCRCNRTGVCRGCACVRANKPCLDCLPRQLGRCQNVFLPSASRPTSPPKPIYVDPIPEPISVSQDPANEIISTSQMSPPWPQAPTLPCFAQAADPTFVWGSLDGPTCVSAIMKCYHVAVHWKPNLFRVPSGKVGNAFVFELSRLFKSYGSSSALESIALTAAMLLPLLLLQRPSKGAKRTELIHHLDRRLTLWKDGAFFDLLDEGNSLQTRLCKRKPPAHSSETDQNRLFAHHMSNGNVKSALRILSDRDKGNILSLDQPADPHSPSASVHDVLIAKHPPPGPVCRESILLSDTPPPTHAPHPVIYDSIDGHLIRRSSFKVHGAGGPSGVDAISWRKFCSSFKSSPDLCHSLALVARRICSTYVDPDSLTSFVACRLIALDKDPGVRPIGIGEVCRRIISKAILTVVGQDVIDAAGPLQLCTGLNGGCEIAVHSIRQLFSDPNSEAILLVDATNAFNSLNRQTALCNCLELCPSLGRILVNTYRKDINLFIDGKTIVSREGTTQGDPLAMAMYSLGVTPLIRHMSNVPATRQVWYADDSSACGSIDNLLSWWRNLTEAGPTYGYFPNPSKTWLLVKEKFVDKANSIFHHTGIAITCDGRPILGSPLGTADYVSSWIESKVDQLVCELTTLQEVSKAHPQEAYSALTHGLMGHWTYLSRTCSDIGSAFHPIENFLCSKLLPSLTSLDPPNDVFRELFALPCRHGGLGIPNPEQLSPVQYHNSLFVCRPIVDLTISQESVIPYEAFASQSNAKTSIHTTNRQLAKQQSESVRTLLSPQLQRLFDIANEKGVSSWLTALPISEHGFNLHKRAFWDAICIRYGVQPSSLPTSCACGSPMSINHCLNCRQGGFTIFRHNDIRDLTARLLGEVCHQVTTEPVLQPLSGESLHPSSANVSDNARLDIKADGFWDCSRQSAFFDVRIFNPTAQTCRSQSLSTCYRRHELEKRRHYEDRVLQIEHGCFTPLVFTTAGGMGPSASIFFKRLASKLATKQNTSYSSVLRWIRCKISFALTHSAILCLRGTRTRLVPLSLDFDRALAECKVQST